MAETTPQTLESSVFRDDLDFKTLENILSTLNHIKPERITRGEYDAKKWDIIQKTDDGKYGNFYTLFLPEDLQVGELASIIRRVNRLTFGEALPKEASTIELRHKIVFAIDMLLEKLGCTTDMQDQKLLRGAIGKYFRLFWDLFPESDQKTLNDPRFRKNILSRGDREKYKAYEERLIRIGTREQLASLLEEVEQTISGELTNHFHEAFFEDSVHTTTQTMETMTPEKQTEIQERYAGKTDATLHQKSSLSRDLNLDKAPRKLRDKIGVDRLKQELTDIRATGDQKAIEKKELEIANTVFRALHEYSYHNDDAHLAGAQPAMVRELQEVQCIGFSFLGHAFLQELDIRHRGIDEPGHSAVEVEIGGKLYYFDVNDRREMRSFSYSSRSTGSYRTIRENNLELPTMRNSDDAESVILAQIMSAKGTLLWQQGKYEEELRVNEAAAQHNPTNNGIQHNIGNALYKLQRDDEALVAYRRAEDLNPADATKSRYMQALIFSSKKQYPEALEILDRAMRSPMTAELYELRWDTLYRLGRYEESLAMHLQTIGFGASQSETYINGYINASIVLDKLGNPELAGAFQYAWTLLSWQDAVNPALPIDPTEERKVRGYVEEWNIDTLSLHLRELVRASKR